ncbi:MAG: protein kinase, partial [Lentisphaeria bacterium]|nr:protein kinase [Lentisphaeria bacterium]
MEYKSGDQICGCTLRQKSGRGAYGEVWLADMDATGARVAVKIISNEGRYSERELAGLRNYKDCSHPNLLNIRFVEITGERICCIMDAADDLNHGQGEYLADTLANRLNKFGRMDGKEITAMLDGLLAGLEELHKHGLVHRDIKPDNILWVNGRPTLADVGLIALDGKGSLVGTPGFMSPKLLSGQGQADASDDFYALGKVIYCALTGLPVGEYPSIPENMTISLDASLGRAFRESCKHPVRSSAEFRSLLQGKSIPAQETDAKKPNTKIWKILAVSVLLLLLAAGGLLWRPGKTVKKTHPKNELDPSSKEAIELDKTLKETEEKMAAVRKKMKALQEEGAARMQAVQSADADSQKDLQDRVRTFFRKTGFLP